MAQRILAADREVILSVDTDVVNPTGKPTLSVFLPVIDGVTVAPGWQVMVTSTGSGNTIVLDHVGLRVVTIDPRGSKLFTAVEYPGYGWQQTDLPTAYPTARLTGGGSGGPIPISQVINLQTTLDGKAPLAHTHAAADIVSGVLAAARLPVSTTASFGAVEVDNNSSGTPIALTASGHGLAADPHPQYILATAEGANNGVATLDGAGKLQPAQLPLGTTASTAAAGNDSRLSDNRAPLAHKTTHQSGGSDEISVAGLLGVLANPQPPIIGATGTTAVAGNDSRLTNARTPTAHAATHEAGGSDAVPLDTLAATTDITALNASTAAHGLLPKLGGGTTNFLRADGTWQAPVAVVPDLVVTRRLCAVNITIPAGYSAYVCPDYEIAAGIYLECAAGAVLEIG